LVVATVCTFSIVAVPECDLPTVGVAAISGTISGGTDLLDMLTGGEKWDNVQAALDVEAVTSPGIGGLIKLAPATTADVGDLVHTGVDLLSGGYSLAKGIKSLF